MLSTLFAATILAGALAGSAMAQAPDAGCALPSEPKGIPAALDAAITGPADKDFMEQLRAAQRRQASRARHQQHSSDQRSGSCSALASNSVLQGAI